MKYDVIILNAGQSKRLRPLLKGYPKALYPIYNNISLLKFHLLVLEKYIDKIDNVLLVVGYKKELFEEFVSQLKLEIKQKIRLVINDKYAETDNAYSVYLALAVAKKVNCKIILDGDILFHPALFEKLLSTHCENALIAEFDEPITEEDSKVLVSNNFAHGIGKEVRGNAIYTSMIKLCGSFSQQFLDEISNTKWWTTWYSAPLNKLLRQNPTTVCVLPTAGYKRMDIDVPEEFDIGRKFIQEIIKYL